MKEYRIENRSVLGDFKGPEHRVVAPFGARPEERLKTTVPIGCFFWVPAPTRWCTIRAERFAQGPGEFAL